MTALALAWVAKNPNTATVILGASKPEQITQNLKALEVIPKLTPEILHKIDQILSNTPAALVCVLSVDDGVLTDTSLAIPWSPYARSLRAYLNIKAHFGIEENEQKTTVNITNEPKILSKS
jgi:hypothetical protein